MLREAGGKTRRVLSLAMSATHELSSSYSASIVTELARLVDDRLVDGVEIDWQKPNLADAELTKKDRAKLVSFVKVIAIVLVALNAFFR